MNFPQFRSRVKKPMPIYVMVAAALFLGACAGLPFDPSQIPFVQQFMPPTPTVPPTATPTPSPTPAPTKPGETATATPQPTPQVTIPQGYTPVKDAERGYSLAVPAGWSPLDLRGSQVQQLANMVGQGAGLTQAREFLDSPAGKPIGVIYITDLMSAMFGGLPTLLNASVIDAPGYTPESAKELIDANLTANAAMLGDVKIDSIDPATVNGLPAVKGSATADLSKYGIKEPVYAKVVGLIANDKIYILVLGTPQSKKAANDPIFDQIIDRKSVV